MSVSINATTASNVLFYTIIFYLFTDILSSVHVEIVNKISLSQWLGLNCSETEVLDKVNIFINAVLS
jgi:hypothetical protein